MAGLKLNPLLPLRDQIIVKPIERKLSSLLIVNNAGEPHNLGVVVSVGDGRYDKKGRHMPLDVKVGDRIKYGNGEYLNFPSYYDITSKQSFDIIREADICAIIED